MLEKPRISFSYIEAIIGISFIGVQCVFFNKFLVNSKNMEIQEFQVYSVFSFTILFQISRYLHG